MGNIKGKISFNELDPKVKEKIERLASNIDISGNKFTSNNLKEVLNEIFNTKLSISKIDKVELNTITTPGFYCAVNCIGCPPGYNYWSIIVTNSTSLTSGLYVQQIAIAENSVDGMYIRRKNNSGGWTPWAKIITEKDLASVATSGSYNDLKDKPTIGNSYTHPSTHPASMITVANSNFSGKDLNSVLNELFISADNGKKSISNTIGSPLSASDSFDNMNSKLQGLKSTLASKLSSKGQNSSSSDSLNNLINKVSNITVGDYKKGEIITSNKFNIDYSYDNTIRLCDQMYVIHSTKNSYYTELDKGVIIHNKDCSKIFFEFDNDDDKYTCYLYDLQNGSVINKYTDISSSIGSTSYTFMQYDKDKDCFFYAHKEEEKHDYGLKSIKTTDGKKYTLSEVQERPSIVLDKNYLYVYLNKLNDTNVIYYKFNYDGTQIWKKNLTGPSTSNAFYYNGYLYVFSEWNKYIEKRNLETFELISKSEYDFNIRNYRLHDDYLYLFNDRQIYIINLNSMDIYKNLTFSYEIKNIHVYNEYLFVLLANNTIIKYKNNIQILSHNKTSFYKDVAILGTEHDIYLFYISGNSLYINYYKEDKSVKSITLK